MVSAQAVAGVGPVSTLVGVLIRAIERIGLGGALAALTLNLGWAFATVFATPVIIVEGTLPIAHATTIGQPVRATSPSRLSAV